MEDLYLQQIVPELIVTTWKHSCFVSVIVCDPEGRCGHKLEDLDHILHAAMQWPL